MTQLAQVEDLLRAYEDDVLLPLIHDAGILRPVRDRIDFTMQPGSFAFLMNNAKDYDFIDGLVHWSPLSVVYTDRHTTTGTVFSLMATYDLKTETAQFQRAEITDVVVLLRRPMEVIWVDPHAGQVFKRFPLEDADKVLMNAWFLFKGAVLPMLMTLSYRFAPPEEKFAFQRTMIRHITRLYERQGA